MNITNNTIIISGPSRTIQKGTLTTVVSEGDWNQFIVPCIYPLWDSDKDVLTTFTYRDDPQESFRCEKKKYVRNHTTGEYFWKDYLFTEVSMETVHELVSSIGEAFDAIAATTKKDVDLMLQTIISREKGLSLTRIKTWRDFFLFSCDWTMLEDAPVTAEEKEQWKLYRQKIRELPDLFDAGTSVLSSIDIPIDPIVYKHNFLPFNDGVGYLATNEQYLSFPNEGVQASALERAMNDYMKIAVKLSRPSPMFNVPSVSRMSDPIDMLVQQIEQEQSLLDELRAQQNANTEN